MEEVSSVWTPVHMGGVNAERWTLRRETCVWRVTDERFLSLCYVPIQHTVTRTAEPKSFTQKSEQT